MDVIEPQYAVLSYHAGHDIELEENGAEAKVTLYCAECGVDLADFTALLN